ncbi:keratin-associated protein 19-2-like [Galleria mellonella]|uniref:Keratin-associated protein 19-2-like n=1 Tax=Galleria mellonella TaxID=7137 RepID=A0A6J3CEN3_GALME|nr:keratin-associated protein 19-2-like [Galleria mellonella]XP_052751928.1 keratin-associated protein 19-2-like [Galleria mellonella]XP_052751934.1 keratin-associated protein 19-2-like [Galleria mellonella]
MAIHALSLLVVILGYTCFTAESEAVKRTVSSEQINKDDLKTDASTYGRRYYDWGGYPSASGYSGYGVTGHGIIDNRYNSFYGGGYDNTYGYSGGYNGYAGNTGYGGYNDYNYNGHRGYGGYGGYGLSSFGGNGGYGGYGGNGGLISYYGYNNPYNQGAYHLGYGYYNKKPGNIYNSGITPNLVTGYRGYSRR